MALDTKARAAQGTVVQLKSELAQSQQSRTEAKTLHANKAFMVVTADPLSLVALKPPSEFGIDAVVSWMQWFGAHIDTATSLKQVRRMPGRLIGESLDRLGSPVFCLTPQTREQHIRLDKTTSNVCTAQLLLANMAAVYAVFQRTDGLKTIAKRVHGVSQLFASELTKLGIDASPFFDTVVFDVSRLSSADLVKALEAKHTNLRAFDPKLVSASFDETHYPEDVHAVTATLKEAGVKGTATPAQLAVDGKVTEAFARTKPYLQQHIFNSIRSETEMMRYMTMSQHKDLYLTTSMISLVSCSWPEVMNIHPFALASNTISYREMLNPCKTGFDACSLQPTSDASGEYAGLLVIRKYQESIGQEHRNVCIIPRSAHGITQTAQ